MKAPHVLSNTMEYALRAMLCIARHDPAPVRLPAIAREIQAPARYLAKILGRLARAGVLVSTRGPAGGFRLASNDKSIALSSIIAVFEARTRRRCLLGHGVCGQNTTCVVHEKWAPIAQSTADFLARTTIGDLLAPTTH